MQTAWESELADFLTRLSSVQAETLGVLMRKREAILAHDTAALEAAGEDEGKIVTRLTECLDERRRLLERAGAEGRPSQGLRELAESFPGAKRNGLADQVRQAHHRARLLQHHSVANWILIQRTLLHLAQLLEIIATGGRLQPTYGKETRTQPSGTLVDRAI